MDVVLLFSHAETKYLTFNNTLEPSESTSFTSEPLGLELNFDFDIGKTVFVMGGISRVQQANTTKAENSIYRLTHDIFNTIAATNTGTDHRDLLRRSIIMSGTITASGNGRWIALKVWILKSHINVQIVQNGEWISRGLEWR